MLRVVVEVVFGEKMNRRSFLAALGITPFATLAIGAPSSPVEQNRVVGTYGHSLWYHNQTYGSIGRWVTLMVAQDRSKSFKNAFTFNTISGATPPNFDQTMPGVTVPRGNFKNWAGTNAAGFTDVVAMVDNFHVPPIRGDMETDPSVAIPAASAVPIDQHFENLFNAWETNLSNTQTFWIYEPWGASTAMPGSPKPIAENGTEGYAGGFTDYKAHTTTTYGHTQFYDDLLSNVKATYPAYADRIKLIPACRVLISVMDNTPASDLGVSDWFEDWAPHGTSTCYCVVGAIVYSCLYQEAAPKPDFTGTGVHATVQSNWSAIASYINSQVNTPT